MFDGFSSMHFDLIDLPHMSSFYYVNWDDPIYDQFDDYMEKLEQEEEKAKQDQRSKGTVRLDYKVCTLLPIVVDKTIFWETLCLPGATKTFKTAPTWTTSRGCCHQVRNFHYHAQSC